VKNILAVIMVFCLTVIPFEVYGQYQEAATQAPPVSQPLVSEGAFALKLATALNLGTPTTEAEAEDMLASVRIAPQNGWIADYPMTPIIMEEVQNAVVDAAASNKLPMDRDEALQAFQGVTAEFGLAILPASGQYPEGQLPTSTDYVQPAVINNYYYSYGPPVVTYYPPPWDYYYLYAWVPYPFYWSGYFFSGYFVLDDFDVVGHHFYHGHDFYHRITNHCRDPRTHAFYRIDPRTGGRGRAVSGFTRHTHERGRGGPGFATPEARRSASSILNRSYGTTRFSPPTGRAGRTYERAQPRMGDGRTLGQSGNRRGHYQNSQMPLTGANRSFNTPSTRGFSRQSVGRNVGNHTPPVRSFSGSSKSTVRPSLSPSRSYHAPPMAGQRSFGGSYGRGFVSSRTTLSAPTRSFDSLPKVSRGSFSRFNGGGHSFGGFSSGGFQRGGGAFHGSGRGR